MEKIFKLQERAIARFIEEFKRICTKKGITVSYFSHSDGSGSIYNHLTKTIRLDPEQIYRFSEDTGLTPLECTRVVAWHEFGHAALDTLDEESAWNYAVECSGLDLGKVERLKHHILFGNLIKSNPTATTFKNQAIQGFLKSAHFYLANSEQFRELGMGLSDFWLQSRRGHNQTQLQKHLEVFIPFHSAHTLSWEDDGVDIEINCWILYKKLEPYI